MLGRPRSISPDSNKSRWVICLGPHHGLLYRIVICPGGHEVVRHMLEILVSTREILDVLGIRLGAQGRGMGNDGGASCLVSE